MTKIADITIIGGGIIGLLTAREFALAGASVCVLEKNAIGQESSWAGGGILLPIYPWRQDGAISALVRLSLNLYPTLTADLKQSTGIDPEWSPCGLYISRNPDIEKAVAWCTEYQVDYQKSTPPNLEILNTNPFNPLWLPHVAHARNPRLLKSVRRDVLDKGIKLIEHCDLHQISIEKNRVMSITTSQGKKAIGHVIVTTGAWTQTLFEHFFPGFTAPEIKPVKGQMLLYEAEQNTLPSMVLEDDQYLIPRLDGKILAGSSVEQSGFDKSTSEQTYKRLKSFAEKLHPALKNMPIINHWAGLRPGTESGIPYICQHPDIENLSINAGHFRNGLVMAPASARLMVDLILDRKTSIDPRPYRLSSPH